jgi:hypothetical protein
MGGYSEHNCLVKQPETPTCEANGMELAQRDKAVNQQTRSVPALPVMILEKAFIKRWKFVVSP